MRIKGIDHIDIAVSDVDECTKVFQKVGFKLLRRTSHHGGTAELKFPGTNQPIFDVHPPVAEHAGGNVGVIHIAFEVDDIQEAYDELRGKGIVFRKAPNFTESTGRILFSICDPDMNGTESIKGWGFYLQFVGSDRKAPIP